jgi:hypothetical protein
VSPPRPRRRGPTGPATPTRRRPRSSWGHTHYGQAAALRGQLRGQPPQPPPSPPRHPHRPSPPLPRRRLRRSRPPRQRRTLPSRTPRPPGDPLWRAGLPAARVLGGRPGQKSPADHLAAGARRSLSAMRQRADPTKSCARRSGRSQLCLPHRGSKSRRSGIASSSPRRADVRSRPRTARPDHAKTRRAVSLYSTVWS